MPKKKTKAVKKPKKVKIPTLEEIEKSFPPGFKQLLDLNQLKIRLMHMRSSLQRDQKGDVIEPLHVWLEYKVDEQLKKVFSTLELLMVEEEKGMVNP